MALSAVHDEDSRTASGFAYNRYLETALPIKTYYMDVLRSQLLYSGNIHSVFACMYYTGSPQITDLVARCYPYLKMHIKSYDEMTQWISVSHANVHINAKKHKELCKTIMHAIDSYDIKIKALPSRVQVPHTHGHFTSFFIGSSGALIHIKDWVIIVLYLFFSTESRVRRSSLLLCDSLKYFVRCYPWMMSAEEMDTAGTSGDFFTLVDAQIPMDQKIDDELTTEEWTESLQRLSVIRDLRDHTVDYSCHSDDVIQLTDLLKQIDGGTKRKVPRLQIVDLPSGQPYSQSALCMASYIASFMHPQGEAKQQPVIVERHTVSGDNRQLMYDQIGAGGVKKRECLFGRVDINSTNACQAMRISGAPGPLQEYLTPAQQIEFDMTGRLPDRPPVCLLCIRHINHVLAIVAGMLKIKELQGVVFQTYSVDVGCVDGYLKKYTLPKDPANGRIGDLLLSDPAFYFIGTHMDSKDPSKPRYFVDQQKLWNINAHKVPMTGFH